jgi:hypothetical protein
MQNTCAHALLIPLYSWIYVVIHQHQGTNVQALDQAHRSTLLPHTQVCMNASVVGAQP